MTYCQHLCLCPPYFDKVSEIERYKHLQHYRGMVMTAGFISQILRIHDCYTTLNNIYRLCISITRYECHAIFYTKVQLYGGIIPIKTLHICYWAPDKPFFGTQSTFGRTAVPFSFVLFSKADVPSENCCSCSTTPDAASLYLWPFHIQVEGFRDAPLCRMCQSQNAPEI